MACFPGAGRVRLSKVLKCFTKRFVAYLTPGLLCQCAAEPLTPDARFLQDDSGRAYGELCARTEHDKAARSRIFGWCFGSRDGNRSLSYYFSRRSC